MKDRKSGLKQKLNYLETGRINLPAERDNEYLSEKRIETPTNDRQKTGFKSRCGQDASR